jgi:hypothetical protein
VDSPVLGSLERKIFYPFTFPITAGPGCIVVIVTLSAHASVKGALSNISAHVGIALAVMVERSRVLLLWLCAENHGACVSRDDARHPSRDRIRLAAHRRTDHMEWG